MRRFKKGDVVIRTGESYYNIVKGEVYTVAGQTATDLSLVGVTGGYSKIKFILYHPVYFNKLYEKLQSR